MNYTGLTRDIMPKIKEVVDLINNIEIDPTMRQRYMERLLSTVGAQVYNKIYEMNAWDMLISHTTGKGIGTQHYGLARISAGAPVTQTDISPLIDEYIAMNVAKAQMDAMKTAIESGKSPRLKRSTLGKTCKWCISKDTKGGWVSNPDSGLFARHASCDCIIMTAGYNSRNGLLHNYTKAKKRTVGDD